MSQSEAITINTQDTDRGYTGQEELDTVNLVDYNARLYDPALGRFLSVDPVIGHPNGTQSINPYSYVENNPLNKTDPTGEDSALSTCQTEACPAMSGGEGIGGIDWAVNVAGKNITVTPTAGPGNVAGHSSSLNQSLGGQPQGLTGQDPTKTADHTKIDNKTIGQSYAGMRFTQHEEGFMDHPYNPHGKTLPPTTIGYGHQLSKAATDAYMDVVHLINAMPLMSGLGRAVANQVFSITRDQGQVLYDIDLAVDRHRLIAVLGRRTLMRLRQNQRDAVYDLGFNVGRLNANWHLVHDLRAGDNSDAAREMLNIYLSHGKVMPGLQTRRAKDNLLFLNGYYGGGQ